MMNKKLIALFVAITTVVSVSANYERNYENYNNQYGNENNRYMDRDYNRANRRQYKQQVVEENGGLVERTGRTTGNLAKDAVEAPGNILFGR